MLKLTYSSIFTPVPKVEIEKEIFRSLNTVSYFFKIISLIRLSGYYGAVSNFTSVAACVNMVIDVGERTSMVPHVALP